MYRLTLLAAVDLALAFAIGAVVGAAFFHRLPL